MPTIRMKHGHEARFDEQDAALVSSYKWSATTGRKKTYAQASAYMGGKRTVVLMHQLLTGCQKGVDVDHINGDGLDNRRENLRVCSRSQNMQNRTVVNSNNKSGVTGVSFAKRDNKWTVRIKVGSVYKNLGYFSDLEEAIAVRRAAEIQCFKEYAPKVHNGTGQRNK